MKNLIYWLKTKVKSITCIALAAVIISSILGCSESPADKIVWKIQDATKQMERAKNTDQAQAVMADLERFFKNDVGRDLEDLDLFELQEKFTEKDATRISDAITDFMIVCVGKGLEMEDL